jgi:26S proteasome regulatory subunit N2
MLEMGVAVEPVVPSSAAPALALLAETEPVLQAHALSTLNSLADSFWPEISGDVDKIQELSENATFVQRDLASLVAAKVLFHLGELDEALRYALAAGHLFDVDADTEFANTLRARCIDEYISLQSKRETALGEAGPSTDSPSTSTVHAFAKELQAVVERVLEGCIQKGEINEAIGVALESQRLDKVREAILKGCKSSSERYAALAYCFECAQTLVSSRQYRTAVLKLISSIHLEHFVPSKRNHLAVANCLAFIGDAQGVVDVLLDLISDDKARGLPDEDDRELTALQIAFDIVDNDEPRFASDICALLPSVPDVPDISDGTPRTSGQPTTNGSGPGVQNGSGDNDEMETEPLLPAPAEDTADLIFSSGPVSLTKEQNKIAKLLNVLSGKVTAALSLDFLCSHNRSDNYLLKQIKQALDGRSSVSHSALVFANAIAHGGTAIDTFLRENLDWLARATAWAKFSATSCLGVIHARHTSSALILLSPYLPSPAGPGGTSSASAYSEGGALYALGLIAATGGRDVAMPNSDGSTSDAKDYLYSALRSANNNEVVQHGACLGLGLASMASWDGVGENEIYDELKTVLGLDAAIASEAAGLAMGLLCLGSGSERICSEMLEYARETQHEKISRGLAMGLALISYGREDDADELIKSLTTDKDPILRYGGMYAVALAYCGTADNKAIRLLLHSAVSDLSDDVRRAAVIAIGFVMFRHPKQVPKIVALLSESCHSHVRYGAAMAVGIACTGTGLPAAVEILERLTTDPTDFVRQGALIGLSLVFMHHTEERSPKAAEIRKLFETTWNTKLEDAVTRFGAVLASGLIDAGGRNGSISLTSATGHRRMSTIVGLAMFTQFWYWFPLVHFIGLSVKPAALIGLNKDLKMPEFQIVSDASPGLYDYVPSGPPEKVKETVRAPTAVLSVTAKSKAREMRRAATAKRKDDEKEPMEEESRPLDTETMKDGLPTGKEGSDGKEEVDDSKKEKPTFAVLNNPCRVVNGQEQNIRWIFEKNDFKLQPRYLPVKVLQSSGILLLRDLRKGEEESLVEMKSLSTAVASPSGGTVTEDTSAGPRVSDDDDDDGPDVPVPAPFEYTDEN